MGHGVRTHDLWSMTDRRTDIRTLLNSVTWQTTLKSGINLLLVFSRRLLQRSNQASSYLWSSLQWTTITSDNHPYNRTVVRYIHSVDFTITTIYWQWEERREEWEEFNKREESKIVREDRREKREKSKVEIILGQWVTLAAAVVAASLLLFLQLRRKLSSLFTCTSRQIQLKCVGPS